MPAAAVIPALQIWYEYVAVKALGVVIFVGLGNLMSLTNSYE